MRLKRKRKKTKLVPDVAVLPTNRTDSRSEYLKTIEARPVVGMSAVAPMQLMNTSALSPFRK